MIVHGKINRILEAGEDGIVEISIPSWQARKLRELDKEVLYAITVKKAVAKKSLNQNNYAWAVMTDIAKKLDYFPEAEAVYLQIIKMAKIKTHYIQVVDDEEVIAAVKRSFRAVNILERTTNAKGNKLATLEVSEGMSKFNKEEMAAFIERLLFFASMNDIDTSAYDFER